MSFEIELPACDDFHVHFRQGQISEHLLSHIKVSSLNPTDVSHNKAGIGRALVMPNTNPPIETAQDARQYFDTLTGLEPSINYLMTLYMTKNTNANLLEEAAKILQPDGSRLIIGLKLYPKGMTTASSHGLLLEEIQDCVLEAMEKLNFSLHIHAELPPTHACTCQNALESIQSNVLQPLDACAEHALSCSFDAESLMLPYILDLCKRYPRLKIVMEHITTAVACQVIQSGPDNLACTISAHHLYLTLESVFGQPWNYCKPIAKTSKDRRALIDLIKSGHPRVFFGSDSAPHPISLKLQSIMPIACQDKEMASLRFPLPGIYTFPFVLPFLATLFETLGLLTQDNINLFKSFVALNGAIFYGLPISQASHYKLIKKPCHIPHMYEHEGGSIQFIPFMASKTLPWSLDPIPTSIL